MQPKTLCFFNTNGPWGGGEHWHCQNALLARDRGYRVCVVAKQGGELARRLADEPGIRLFTPDLGGMSFLNPLTMAGLVHFFRREAVDAVLLCLPRDVKAGGVAAKLAGVPDIIYRRGIAVPVRDRFLNRLLFGRVLTKLIVNSEETRRCVLAENPHLIAPERIHLIYNGFDTAEFDARPSMPLVPRRPGELVIGTAGRLTEQKGQHLLLEAAALLKDTAPPFRLLIAGTGELEAELRAQTTRLGLEDRVEFLGFVQDMKAFHQSIDIFALPSLWEGFGFVLAEAMTMRLPVAAFAVSSIPEVVEHGVTGLLCAPETHALAHNLRELLNDATLRARMGAAGRARVLERFDLVHAFDGVEACLRASSVRKS
ncbi:MAG TPA: glycosyltransferase family 4 protein [Humidesulfovibrio sp.]|uniref:glycosyltransferase family 4 protein n=1 Tax=Humidesulfovibrio sp. TaxID=2910988 RepID=UPI002C49BB89|nr:glycosyltransferase family 4 protein [Humidesulfovibrio sp.]HWR03444.1 glycosyltransferase family 4 protein [Humidesulfovibrio sp.]